MINNFFDKIYVLSLRRSIERRSTVKERLDNAGIEFQFFDAYDGNILNYVWKNFNNPYISTPNYLACQLSHLAIYNDALNNNYQRILILEDDVKPIINLNERFENIKDQIPSDWELLYFGWIPLSDNCQFWQYNIIDDRFISENIFNAKNLWGLYAYSPSQSLMQELLELYTNNFPMEIDRYFVENIQQQRKSYAIRPQLFAHDIGVSNNGGFVDDQSLKKSIDHRFVNENDYL